MCEPVSIATAGMTAASMAIGGAQAVVKSSAENSAAGAANQAEANRVAAGNADVLAQQRQNDQIAINAEASRNQEWNAQGIRQEQEIEAASGTMMDNAIRAKQARAKAEASAADAGVEGVSVEAAARQVYREQGRLDASTVKNLDMSIASLQDEKVQSEAKRVGRTQFSPIRGPLPAQTKAGSSMLDLGLGIAGAGLNAGSIYYRGTASGGRGRA